MPFNKKMARIVLQQNVNHKENARAVLTKRGWCWSVISTAATIALYFILSIGLTFYQRWLLQKCHFPLFVVVCHLVIKFITSAMYRSMYAWLSLKRRVTLDWNNCLYKMAPTGIASGLDVGFSNWGIELITVSLYTMTKSTSIVFILGFALLFKLEKKSWTVFMIVLMIAGGLGMFTYKATQFDTLGFILVLFASFSSGLRWTLAQFMMQRAELGLKSPIDMMYYVQPWMLMAVLPFAFVFEGKDVIEAYHKMVNSQDSAIVGDAMSLIMFGALIALAMELCEYLVVLETSSLTLSVAGIVKEICTLVLAVQWNGDEMTPINLAGLSLCLGGIICHVIHKAVKTNNETSTILHKPLLDEASAHFLAEDTSTEEEVTRDDSSTEILFSILNSRDS